MMKLFVRNSSDELIGEFDTSPKIVDTLFESPVCDKLIVTDYSKDQKVLNFSADEHSVMINIKGTNDQHDQKLRGFGKYLNHRKAGIVKHFGMTIYILTPKPDQTAPLVCICPVKLLAKGNSMPHLNAVESKSTATSGFINTRSGSHVIDDDRTSPVVASNVNEVAKSVSSGEGKSVALPSSMTSSAKGANGADNSKKSSSAPSAFNFLSSLANQMSASNKIRVESAKISASEQANKTFLSTLQKKIQDLVSRFEVDTLLNEVHLEPMNKDERTCVHNIIAEYSHLRSASASDFDDRHVVVFRVGHEPVGVEINTKAIHIPRGAHVKSSTTRSTASTKNDLMTGIVSVESLIKVDQVKRDRRAIEEVQEEMKRRKLQEQHGDGSA